MDIFVHMVHVDSRLLNTTLIRMANKDMVLHGISNFSARPLPHVLLVGCA